MRKIIRFTLLLILILYLILLLRFLMIEEIFGLLIVPIIVIGIISGLIYLIALILKKINYNRIITISLIIISIMQIAILGLILWSISPQYYNRNQVTNDIDYAIKIMEDVHPNLYAEISKESFLIKTDSIKKTVQEKISNLEAYKKISIIFSLIKDGHTGVGGHTLFNRGAFFFRKKLPYKFYINNDKIYVVKNYFWRNTIPIGSEIISINGKSASKCIQEISLLFSYESMSRRNAILQNPLIWSEWNDFKEFEICYKSPDKKTNTTIKSSGSLISTINIFKDSKPSYNYRFKVISGSIGYLEFNSFYDLDKFKVFLDSTFNLIKEKRLDNLIIDIRRNGGGDSRLGDELIQYIFKSDFRQFDSCFTKISSTMKNMGELNWIDSSKRIVGTMINDTNEAQLIKLRANPLRYYGQIYLLTSGNTFSSASSFSSAFKCYNMGKIIGTETGGITVCFGDLYIFKLPNIKFGMNVSKRKYYQACGIDNKHGVIPDYIVDNTFEDQIRGIDRIMEFTNDLIKRNKK